MSSSPRVEQYPPRILVLDADADMRRALPDAFRYLLGRVEVDGVSTVDAAMNLLVRRSYDLIIADLPRARSPQIELLDALREVSLSTPIMLTSVTHSLAQRLPHLSNVVCLLKPFDRGELVTLVKQCIARNHQITRSDESIHYGNVAAH